MVVVLKHLIFVLACLADDFSYCLASKKSLKVLQSLLLLGVSFDFVKSSVQKLMCVLLNVCLNGFSLIVLHCKTKSSWIIILFLAPFQVDVHLLQLIEKIID